jgi:hypothetical protein
LDGGGEKPSFLGMEEELSGRWRRGSKLERKWQKYLGIESVDEFN